jgi:hypothetical protein
MPILVRSIRHPNAALLAGAQLDCLTPARACLYRFFRSVEAAATTAGNDLHGRLALSSISGIPNQIAGFFWCLGAIAPGCTLSALRDARVGRGSRREAR